MGPKMGQTKNPGTGVDNGRQRSLGSALVALVLAACPALASPFGAAHDMVLTAITAGAVAMAIAAGLWALSQQNVAGRLRRTLRIAGARTRAAVGERDALLGAAREALIVWGRDGAGPYSYGGGETLLDSCLKGAQATQLSTALDDLSERGAPFALSVHDALERAVSVRGRAVGGMAAVWIEPETRSAAASTDFRAMLDALPVPVWLRDRTLSLVWGNRAFLTAAGAADLDAASREQVALEKTERDLAASARTQNQPVESKRFAVIAGQRRALAFTEVPVEAGVIGTASDVTEVVAGEARLQQHIDAHTDTLDKLATAVAIFDRDQKLSFYNRAFAKLWGLAETWLDTHPGDGEVLDRLREARKLPEQRDYQAWKRERLALYQTARDYPSEELWHVPSGKTLRVVAQPHPFGGLTFLYEDVTERHGAGKFLQHADQGAVRDPQHAARRRRRVRARRQAQAAQRGVRPNLGLDAKELAGEPHVRAIAAACAGKFGEATMWERLIQNIVSGADLQRDMGEIERGDHTILSLALAPLPDGATLVTFADVTDRFRIESVLRDRAEALEAADRLKSDFIKHVSYELRTPLNTILGFAEHLASRSARTAQRTPERIYPGHRLGIEHAEKPGQRHSRSGAGGIRRAAAGTRTRRPVYAARRRGGACARMGRKVGLSLELDCRRGAGRFLADARRMRQVVFNLLSNAFKFTPQGRRHRAVGRIVGEDVQNKRTRQRAGHRAGSQRQRVRTFLRPGPMPASARGAGLGLALVNRFLELHDGWVEIESGERHAGALPHAAAHRGCADADIGRRAEDRVTSSPNSVVTAHECGP